MTRDPTQRPTGHTTRRLVTLGLGCAAIGFWVGLRWNVTDHSATPPSLDAPQLREYVARDAPIDLTDELLPTSKDTLPGAPALETHEQEAAPEYLAVVPWDRVCILVGRLFDENDELVVDTSLRLGLHYGEHRFGDYVQTNSGGEFRFPVKGSVPAGEVGILEIERGTPPYRLTRYVPPNYQAVVEIPDLLPNGELDLGDVQLIEKPAMVTGTVLDREGTPLIAKIEVGTFRPEDEVPRLWSLYSDDDGEFSLSTGRFDLHRLETIHRGWLTVECPGFASILELPFTPGAHVAVQMDLGTEVRGTITGTRTDPLAIILTGSDGVERSPRGWSPGEEQYEWWIFNVPLGRASLSIRDARGRSFVGTFDVREGSTVPTIYGVLLR